VKVAAVSVDGQQGLKVDVNATGLPGNIYAALIERGTQPSQRVIRGTLDQLPELAVGVESPALIMVGSVVTLADQLAWFGQGCAADAALASA
jgi:uroporphyrin-III C-methyltransferase/precorrin-2 dehydrogenase/sirohydrochlorin ferrochelatase